MTGFPAQTSAQEIANLPAPGTMVLPSSGFNPTTLSGMVLDKDNPFQFDFIIDRGDKSLPQDSLKKETKKLIQYFMTTLTVPDEEMWVNLSPYEKDRIIAPGLGETVMGRDMLIQDYLLKQLSASLMYPDEKLGSEFWERVYAKTQAKFGTTDIPVNTFHKIWIVPKEAVVFVNKNKVFIVNSHLSVMLEEDYLAMEMNKDSTKHGVGDVPDEQRETFSAGTKKILREILIPEIEKEVNTGKTFANLRQIYSSMILATWYKQHLQKSVFALSYIDQNKTDGIDVADKDVKNKIYRQYTAALKKGVFDFIREDFDPKTQQIIPRKYFSGGLEKVRNLKSIEQGRIPLALAERKPDNAMRVRVLMNPLKKLKASLITKTTALFISGLLCAGGCSTFQKQDMLDTLRPAMQENNITVDTTRPLSEENLLTLSFQLLNSDKISPSMKKDITEGVHNLFKKAGNGLIPLYTRFDPAKPTVLFIHGAGGEGGAINFIDSFKKFYQDANLIAFQYDYLRPISEIAGELTDAWKTFKQQHNFSSDVIIGAHSFGNPVLDEAFLLDADGEIFNNVILKSFAPTFGGSATALGYGEHLPYSRYGAQLFGYGNPAEAQNPNGKIQAALTSPENIAHISAALVPNTAETFLVPNDQHNPPSAEEQTLPENEKTFKENFDRRLGITKVTRLDTSVTHSSAPAQTAGIAAIGREIDKLSSELSAQKVESALALKNSDKAQTVKNVGGIDFNPQGMNLTTKGSNAEFTFSDLSQGQINSEDISGYEALIKDIMPVPDFQTLLKE